MLQRVGVLSQRVEVGFVVRHYGDSCLWVRRGEQLRTPGNQLSVLRIASVGCKLFSVDLSVTNASW